MSVMRGFERTLGECIATSQFDPSATSGLISLATKQRGAHYPTQDLLSCQMIGPCPGTLRRAFCCGIGPNRMVSLSAIVLGRWASRRSSLLRDHPGRTLPSSISSVRSAANVWITLSSSTSVTWAASVGLFSIIVTPGRISRSTRTARRSGPYTDLPQARSLPSQRSADCIMATAPRCMNSAC
jgi:hypothetical protein